VICKLHIRNIKNVGRSVGFLLTRLIIGGTSAVVELLVEWVPFRQSFTLMSHC